MNPTVTSTLGTPSSSSATLQTMAHPPAGSSYTHDHPSDVRIGESSAPETCSLSAPREPLLADSGITPMPIDLLAIAEEVRHPRGPHVGTSVPVERSPSVRVLMPLAPPWAPNLLRRPIARPLSRGPGSPVARRGPRAVIIDGPRVAASRYMDPLVAGNHERGRHRWAGLQVRRAERHRCGGCQRTTLANLR